MSTESTLLMKGWAVVSRHSPRHNWRFDSGFFAQRGWAISNYNGLMADDFAFSRNAKAGTAKCVRVELREVTK